MVLSFFFLHLTMCPHAQCNIVDWPNAHDTIHRLSRLVSHLNGTRPSHGLLTALPRARSFISLVKTTANSERYWNVIYMHYIYHSISFCCSVPLYLHSQAPEPLLQKSFGKVTIQIDRVVMLGSVAGEYTLLPESKSGPNRNLEIEFQWSNKWQHLQN